MAGVRCQASGVVGNGLIPQEVWGQVLQGFYRCKGKGKGCKGWGVARAEGSGLGWLCVLFSLLEWQRDAQGMQRDAQGCKWHAKLMHNRTLPPPTLPLHPTLWAPHFSRKKNKEVR